MRSNNTTIPAGLTTAVKEYFATHFYKGFDRPFILSKLEKTCLYPHLVYAIPEGVEEILGEDTKWEKKLAKIGKEFGVTLELPYYCYGK